MLTIVYIVIGEYVSSEIVMQFIMLAAGQSRLFILGS